MKETRICTVPLILRCDCVISRPAEEHHMAWGRAERSMRMWCIWLCWKKVYTVLYPNINGEDDKKLSTFEVFHFEIHPFGAMCTLHAKYLSKFQWSIHTDSGSPGFPQHGVISHESQEDYAGWKISPYGFLCWRSAGVEDAAHEEILVKSMLWWHDAAAEPRKHCVVTAGSAGRLFLVLGEVANPVDNHSSRHFNTYLDSSSLKVASGHFEIDGC